MEKVNSEKKFTFKKITPSSTISQEFNNIIKINYISRYDINIKESVLPPPHALPQRKNIPLNSPKFGRNFNYM